MEYKTNTYTFNIIDYNLKKTKWTILCKYKFCSRYNYLQLVNEKTFKLGFIGKLNNKKIKVKKYWPNNIDKN